MCSRLMKPRCQVAITTTARYATASQRRAREMEEIIWMPDEVGWCVGCYGESRRDATDGCSYGSAVSDWELLVAADIGLPIATASTAATMTPITTSDMTRQWRHRPRQACGLGFSLRRMRRAPLGGGGVTASGCRTASGGAGGTRHQSRAGSNLSNGRHNANKCSLQVHSSALPDSLRPLNIPPSFRRHAALKLGGTPLRRSQQPRVASLRAVPGGPPCFRVTHHDEAMMLALEAGRV